MMNVCHTVHACLAMVSVSNAYLSEPSINLYRIDLNVLEASFNPLRSSSLPWHRTPDVPLLGLDSNLLPQRVLATSNIHWLLLQHSLVVSLAEVNLCVLNIEML